MTGCWEKLLHPKAIDPKWLTYTLHKVHHFMWIQLFLHCIVMISSLAFFSLSPPGFSNILCIFLLGAIPHFIVGFNTDNIKRFFFPVAKLGATLQHPAMFPQFLTRVLPLQGNLETDCQTAWLPSCSEPF